MTAGMISFIETVGWLCLVALPTLAYLEIMLRAFPEENPQTAATARRKSK